MQTSPGLATQLIDGCFASKLAHCRQVDSALCFKGTEPWSCEGQLQFWYAVRRPGFEWLDLVTGFRSASD